MPELIRYNGVDGENYVEVPVKIDVHSVDDLINRLHTVKLRNSNTEIYKDVKISVKQLVYTVQPAQLYVLRDNLVHLHNLDLILKERFNISIFEVESWVALHYEGGQSRAVLPPVIEEETDKTGSLLVCDGCHRVYLARKCNRPLNCVYISQPSVPYYAYRNSWSDVLEVDALHEGIIKKYHRFWNFKNYYRDFNSAFPEVGNSRAVKSQGA